jgi:hypothetical protein
MTQIYFDDQFSACLVLLTSLAEGLAGLEKLHHIGAAGGKVGLAGGGGKVPGLCGSRCGVGETPRFGVRCGEGLQFGGIAKAGQVTSAYSEVDGICSVAEGGVGRGGEDPGETIEGIGVVRFETDGFAALGNGVGGLLPASQGEGEMVANAGV